MTPDQMRAEVLNTEQAIWENGSRYEVKGFFRFPYGDYDANVLRLLEELGYDYTIWWGCDSKAWMGHTADDIVGECGTERAAPGLIVLLHVDTDPDFAALRGDPSDNLPSIPSVGEKTAAKLIMKYGGLDGIFEHLDEQTPKLRENLAHALESEHSFFEKALTPQLSRPSAR